MTGPVLVASNRALYPELFDILGGPPYNDVVPIDLEGFVAPGSEEEALLRQLDMSALPRHAAVIMDGNGRWAERRRLARIEGHRAAAKAVEDAVETCARLGV